jgi:pimeloyl-ACP methyl ester carboxylesterase
MAVSSLEMTVFSDDNTELPAKIRVFRLVFQQPLFWLLTTYFRSSLNSMMGVPTGFELTAEQKAGVADVMKTLLPDRPRADGAVLDMFVSNADINGGYPLEEIPVPVLIVNAVDDPLWFYKNAKSMAERIPAARLVTIESGGHMLLGQEERVRLEITTFLEDKISPRP